MDYLKGTCTLFIGHRIVALVEGKKKSHDQNMRNLDSMEECVDLWPALPYRQNLGDSLSFRLKLERYEFYDTSTLVFDQREPLALSPVHSALRRMTPKDATQL